MAIKVRKNWFKYYLHVFTVTAKARIMDRMVDSSTFIVMGIMAVIEIVTALIFIEAIYGQTNSLAGWNKGEVIILTGTAFLIKAISYITYVRSLNRVGNMINSSRMDLVITKPISTKFYLCTFNSDLLFAWPQFIFSIFLIFYGTSLSGGTFNIPGFVAILIFGIFLHFHLVALIFCLPFHTRFSHMLFLTEEIENLGRYPRQIYRYPFNTFLTFILPAAIVFNLPVEVLRSKIQFTEMIPLLVVSIIFMILAQIIFTYSINSYESNKV